MPITSKSSLLPQIGTRSAPSSAVPAKIRPEIYFPFALYSTSLLPIIDGMKGLNCLPLFGSHGGLKKSPTPTQMLYGFVRPVTLRASGLVPFICYAVVGLLSYLGDIIGSTIPATVVFSSAHSIRGGRFPVGVFVRCALLRGVRLCFFGSF